MDRKDLLELSRRVCVDSPICNLAVAELQDLVCTNSVVELLPPRANRRARTRQCIHRLKQILEESPQMTLTLDDLAQLLNLERTYCCKLFQELTGAYFSHWIRKIRIAKAQSLLRLSAYTITEVSHAVGYDDITTFSRNFRKELGLSPRSFRRQSLKVAALANNESSVVEVL
jgi:YesN/AraC family two-component response regulator